MPIPFELRPDMPEEGLSAAENGLGHTEHVEAQLLRDASEHGRPMVLPDHIPKTHRAIVMAEVARDGGPELYAAVHDAIFSAYYGEGRDIGDAEVLLGIAREHGLDEAGVHEAWNSGAYEERLHAYYHLALQLGVGTTPAGLVCKRLIVGTRPYRVLREAMQECTGAGERRADA